MVGIVQVDPQIPLMAEKSLTIAIVANRLTGEAMATAADRNEKVVVTGEINGTDDVLGVTRLGTISGAWPANGTSAPIESKQRGRLLAIRYCILTDGL
jgi:hypothetical protein